jgi:hypothetical protein
MASPVAKQALRLITAINKINDLPVRAQAIDQQCDGFASPLDIRQDKP